MSFKPTIQKYDELTQNLSCRWCGGALGKIEKYPHDGGWPLQGYEEKQWLYKVCLKCGYQWALWKLGVERP